jgi:hypothetical protein
MANWIEADASKSRSRLIAVETGYECVSRFVKCYGDQNRQQPDRNKIERIRVCHELFQDADPEPLYRALSGVAYRDREAVHERRGIRCADYLRLDRAVDRPHDHPFWWFVVKNVISCCIAGVELRGSQTSPVDKPHASRVHCHLLVERLNLMGSSG